MCTVNIAKGGQNATDIKKDEVGAECHKGPFCEKVCFKGGILESCLIFKEQYET